MSDTNGSTLPDNVADHKQRSARKGSATAPARFGARLCLTAAFMSAAVLLLCQCERKPSTPALTPAPTAAPTPIASSTATPVATPTTTPVATPTATPTSSSPSPTATPTTTPTTPAPTPSPSGDPFAEGMQH